MNLIPAPKQRSFKKVMLRVLVLDAFAGVVLAVFGVGITHLPANSDMQAVPTDPGTSVLDGRPLAKGSPAAVMAKHADHCWTEEQEPKADLPGAAVVQAADGTTTYTKKHAVVDAAFNEALASIGYAEHRDNLPFADVIALCV